MSNGLRGLVRVDQVDEVFAAAGVPRAQRAAEDRRLRLRCEELVAECDRMLAEVRLGRERHSEERRDLNAGWCLVGVCLTAFTGAIIGGSLAGRPGWWAAAIFAGWSGYLLWSRRCSQ